MKAHMVIFSFDLTHHTIMMCILVNEVIFTNTAERAKTKL